MFTAIQRVSETIARRWCHVMHPDPMWPVKGMYKCPKCHRMYRVPWEELVFRPAGDSHKVHP
jgi:hypothetical protein